MKSSDTPRAPEPGLLLRLAGPLQSWGVLSHFNERDTARFPTRSGVIGLLAAAFGIARDEPLDGLNELSVTVRVDRPGVLLRDLHTVGGGMSAKDTVTTADGGKRSGATGTLLSHRMYLADAAFTVAVTTSGSEGLLSRCADAVRAPQWPLFLGRRSCPPEGPLLLGQSDDALHHLVHLPLAAKEPRMDGADVEFLSDQPLGRLPLPMDDTPQRSGEGLQASSILNDEPLSFHVRHRAYRARPLYRRTVALRGTPYAGLGIEHLKVLHSYLTAHKLVPEGSH